MVETAAEVAARQAEIRRVQASMPQVTNPAYGTNEFDSNSYLSTTPTAADVAANPALAEPLPNTREIDPSMPSPLNTARMGQIKEFRANPQKYIQGHATVQLNEQSIIDRGKSMMSRIFDYRDDADLQMFGVNLSAVESVWDSVIRHVTGAYDVSSVGVGWALSALPGGIQTLDGGQLSGEKSFMQVLNGEMNPGDAPSPGQILVANAAADAKRVREGGISLSSALAFAGSSGPLLLAGLAAENSPLQADGFDITNKAQRDAAFGNGWEKWMSGISDAGFAFADPMIGAGVALKVTRLGMLGARGTIKDAGMIAQQLKLAADENMALVAKHATETTKVTTEAHTVDSLLQQALDHGQAKLAQVQQTSPIKQIETGVVRENEPSGFLMPEITTDMTKPDRFETVLGEFMWDVSQKYAAGHAKAGQAVMTVDDIAARPEIAALTNRAGAASLLHAADSPMMVNLVIQSLNGSKDALKNLHIVTPALADETLRYTRENIRYLATAFEGGKTHDSSVVLDQMHANLETQRQLMLEQMRRYSPDGRDMSTAKGEAAVAWQDAAKRHDILAKSQQEVLELKNDLTGVKPIDPLDDKSAFYQVEKARAILADLHSRDDVLTKALNDEIYNQAEGARKWLPGKDNFVSRATVEHRRKTGIAARQYAEEGAGLYPARKLISTTEDIHGDVTHQFDRDWKGWRAGSQYEGVSWLQRRARVWRWISTETPNGYIALKGTNTVGSEREFNAAMDLEMYKGDAKVVTRPMREKTQDPNIQGAVILKEDGTPMMETFTVGGAAKRAEFSQRFMAALNDPTQDAFTELTKIESEIMGEMADMFGHKREQFAELLGKANGFREQSLKTMREEGYFIGETGDREYVPYLSTHLANGTYMQNFTELEKTLKRLASKDNGEKVRQAFATPAHMAGDAYELFNSFWRPLTLLRLGYTTRNVFEGMVRAMAYSSSLVPLTWPARATANGIRNKIVKGFVKREVARGEAALALNGKDYLDAYHAYAAAEDVRHRLAAAHELTLEGDSEPMMYVFRKGLENAVEHDRYTPTEYEALYKAAAEKSSAMEDQLRASVQMFDNAVKDTKFGDWRQKNLEALAKEKVQYQSVIDNLTTLMNLPDHKGNLLSIERDSSVIGQVADIQELIAYANAKMDNIALNPHMALAEYAGQAGRQRRIGSGTSMGPDGGEYSNAWDGPLEQINRGNMSADATTKQRFSLVANTSHGLLTRRVEMTHQPIAYSETHPDEWAAGMADIIEKGSSVPLVQQLVHNGFDPAAATEWMMSSPQGQAYARSVAHLFSEEHFNPLTMKSEGALPPSVSGQKIVVDGEVKQNPVFTQTEDGRTGITPFSKDERDLSGRTRSDYNREQVHAYVVEVADRMHQQMQGKNEFYTLLKRRVNEKTGAYEGHSAGGMNKAGAAQAPVTSDNIKTILKTMPADRRATLHYTQGSHLLELGSANAMDIYRHTVDTLFRILGTIPEDAVTRGPFYAQRFKQTRNAMIEQYWESQNTTAAKVKAATSEKLIGPDGNPVDFGLVHPEFKIPAKELNRIIEQSHRRALMDTKEWMYTIDRRTNLGKYGEWIFPFISATQNSVTVGGKLLYKEPWLAPFVHDLWAMPQKAGFEDDQGNLHIVVPENWVTNTLKNNPDIPFLGGAIGPDNELTVTKNGMNVFMPETGFGFAPTPSPLIQVAASELMKANLLSVETPQLLKNALGTAGADEVWGQFKDYVFGENQSLSSTMGSVDKLAPAWIRRAWSSKSELTSEYGYTYTLTYQSELARWRAGERDDKPTEDEINKRVTNQFLFRMLGNLGIPTPYTPYPIVTPPQITNPSIQLLTDTLNQYKKADPANGSANFARDFGDWALPAANAKVTLAAGGATQTPETVSDINTFDHLIRGNVDAIGNNWDVLGILVNNRADASVYDKSSGEWESAHVIPGTSREWRPVMSVAEAEMERQRTAGWTQYRRTMDNLDARLQNMGFKSYESQGAQELRAARKQAIDNMLGNKDYAGWAVDYQDRSGDRTIAAVRVMSAAVADPTFIGKMTEWGKANTLSAMTNYISYRTMVLNSLKASGTTMADPQNAGLKEAWAIIRQQLKASSVRWADIANQYLTGDDDPAQPGAFSDVTPPTTLQVTPEPGVPAPAPLASPVPGPMTAPTMMSSGVQGAFG